MDFLKHKHEYPSHINIVWFFEAVIRIVSILRAFKLKFEDYYNRVHDYMRNIKLTLIPAYLLSLDTYGIYTVWIS